MQAYNEAGFGVRFWRYSPRCRFQGLSVTVREDEFKLRRRHQLLHIELRAPVAEACQKFLHAVSDGVVEELRRTVDALPEFL